MNFFNEWLNAFVTSKEVWTYLVASFIGVLFTFVINIYTEERKIKLKDIILFIGYVLVIGTIAVQVDVSPLLSLTIGLAREQIWKTFNSRSGSIADAVVGLLGKGLSKKE